MIFEWDFWVFVSAFSVAAFSPGPGIAAVVATVLAGGARRVIWLCVGIIIGDLVWLMLSLSGLALIAQNVPVVFTVIKWGGVAYLSYLAVKMWRSNPESLTAVADPPIQGWVSRLFAGVSITMGNPKAALFYLALLPSIIHTDALTWAATLPLAIVVVIVLGSVFGVYVLAAARARRALSNARSIAKFNRVSATALGGAALWIASK